MAPLGLGLSITGASEGDSSIAVVIEDYLWELVSAGNLQPRDVAESISDFSDSWDLEGSIPYDYKPASPSASEGYWERDGGNLKPLDV